MKQLFFLPRETYFMQYIGFVFIPKDDWYLSKVCSVTGHYFTVWTDKDLFTIIFFPAFWSMLMLLFDFSFPPWLCLHSL